MRKIHRRHGEESMSHCSLAPVRSAVVRGVVMIYAAGLGLSTASALEPEKSPPRVSSLRASQLAIVGEAADRSARLPMALDSIPTLRMTTNGRVHEFIEPESTRGGIAGGECGELTHTDPSNFTAPNPVELVIQQGFVEGEIAYATYELDPSAFPITLRAAECVFAQQTDVATITQWTLEIWDGPPIPRIGIEVASFSSDDIMLNHLRMSAGLAATNVRVEIDPSDPEQIIIANDSGFNTLTIGFRIDAHNDPSLIPCLLPASGSSNAFPTTDVDGLISPSGNWMFALQCGLDPTCEGEDSFAGRIANGCPTPTGDWLIRATFECSFIGACCDVNAGCADNIIDAACIGQGGTFMGDGVLCSEVDCPTPVGACCRFVDDVGVCNPDVGEPICEGISGVYMGNGVACDDEVCLRHACCMPSGECVDLLGVECEAAGGELNLEDDCSIAYCVQPTGSCCIDGFCLENQPRNTCELQGIWNGLGSTCDPDPCACPAATIVGASPPSGTIDARQPSAPSNPLPRLGIGSSEEPIVITLGVAGAEECFSLCETATDSVLGANGITSVHDLGGGVYEIVLDHAITAGAVTTISYIGNGDYIEYTSHPANVNADSASGPPDILYLIDVLNGVATAPHGLYSVDVDHSDSAEPPDILRVIDLLNGAGVFNSWLNTNLPVNTSCP